jgi:hypothetical protein
MSVLRAGRPLPPARFLLLICKFYRPSVQFHQREMTFPKQPAALQLRGCPAVIYIFFLSIL